MTRIRTLTLLVVSLLVLRGGVVGSDVAAGQEAGRAPDQTFAQAHVVEVQFLRDWYYRYAPLEDREGMYRRLEAWTRGHPSDAEALYFQAHLSRTLNPATDARGAEYQRLLLRAADAGSASAQADVGYQQATGVMAESRQGEGLARLRDAVDRGDVEGYYLTGVLVLHGAGGVERDVARAEALLRRAVELRSGRARQPLGHALLRLRRFPEALAELEAAAIGWDVDAARDLAGWLAEGTAGPRDLPRALGYYRAVAERTGSAADALKVARMLRDGVGTAPNAAESVRWVRRAADRGDPVAKYLLGQHTLLGDGTPADVRLGLALLTEAAEAGGVVEAHVALGTLYLEGACVPRDVGHSLRWFREAERRGSAVAATYVRALDGKGRDGRAAD